MSDYAGSILHLRKMAVRCRDAAKSARSPEEEKTLLGLAVDCEERALEREGAVLAIASEED
jgi:hypothetical protein